MNNTNFTSFKVSGESIDWQALAYFNIFRTIAAFLTNSIVLYVFLSTPSLRSPFNVYLIDLLVNNLFITVGMGPLDVYNNLNRTWMLGTHVCTLYLYFQWTTITYLFYIHATISMNRIWAIFWPIHYRHHHNRRIAIMLCFLTFLYSHLWSLPFLILDELYYRLPIEENGCTPNLSAQNTYSITMILAWADAPLLFVIIACPIVLRKQSITRKRKMINKVMSTVHNNPHGVTAKQTTEEDEHGNRIQHSLAAERGSTKSHGLLIMTLLTASVTIFWVPNVIFFNIVAIAPDLYNQVVDIVTGNMLIMQAIVDPILFGIALKDVRVAVTRLVGL